MTQIMELCNLTSKAVAIVDEHGQLIMEYPSRGFAQCEVEERQVDNVDGVVISSKRFKPPYGLPEQAIDKEIYYIVDDLVAEAVRDTRYDIVIPTNPRPTTKYPNAFMGLMKI